MNAVVDWQVLLPGLHDSELDVAELLADIASRHDKDLDFHADCLRMARLSTQHVSRIAALGRDHGEELDPGRESSGLLGGLRDWAAGLLGGPRQVELLRVGDLRRVVLTASAVVLDWQLLGEVGTLSGAADLTLAAAECRAETDQQIAWATRQILARGSRLFTTETNEKKT
jgi:hypothetical protein